MELFHRVSPSGGTPIGRVLQSRVSEYLRSWETQVVQKDRTNIWNKFVRFGSKKSQQGSGKSEAPPIPKPINFLVITDGCPSESSHLSVDAPRTNQFCSG